MKLLLLGDPSSKKRDLLYGHVRGGPEPDWTDGIPMHVMMRTLTFRSTNEAAAVTWQLRVMIWDLSGSPRWRGFREAYGRGARGAIVVESADANAPLESMRRWAQVAVAAGDGAIPIAFILNTHEPRAPAVPAPAGAGELLAQFPGSTFMVGCPEDARAIEAAMRALGSRMLDAYIAIRS